MKVYKEVWKDGKLVVDESETGEAAPVVRPVVVDKLLLMNGVDPKSPPTRKLFNRPDAKCTDL